MRGEQRIKTETSQEHDSESSSESEWSFSIYSFDELEIGVLSIFPKIRIAVGFPEGILLPDPVRGIARLVEVEALKPASTEYEELPPIPLKNPRRMERIHLNHYCCPRYCRFTAEYIEKLLRCERSQMEELRAKLKFTDLNVRRALETRRLQEEASRMAYAAWSARERRDGSEIR